MKDKTRGYAHRIDLTADVQTVWRALTDPALLAAWCSPKAEIRARAGGLFRACVDRVTELEAHIDVCEPGRRLRLIYLPSAALPAADSALIDDFILEPGPDRRDHPAPPGLGDSGGTGMGRAVSALANGLAGGHEPPEGRDRECRPAGAGRQVTGFILRAVISAIGLWIATRWVPGIRIDNAGTLVLAGILLGVVNAIVRPILIILTLPITIVSLGLFLLVVNTAMVALVALILPGFQIYGGFSSAFATWLIVWITGWLGSLLIGPQGKIDVHVRRL